MYLKQSTLIFLIPFGILLGFVSACGNDSRVKKQPTSESLSDTETQSNQKDKLPASNFLIALSGEGVLLVNEETGSTNMIAFETELEASKTLISNVLGAPTDILENNECGAGPMTFVTWDNGFTINALQNKFKGWSVRPQTKSAAMTTLDGVGLGTTLSELESRYETEVFESTLGIEFNASKQLFGLLSEDQQDGMVINLWSGIACNFR